jgi:hypothetical protein
MWGVLETVILGAKIEVPVDQQLEVLEFLKGYVKRKLWYTCLEMSKESPAHGSSLRRSTQCMHSS